MRARRRADAREEVRRPPRFRNIGKAAWAIRRMMSAKIDEAHVINVTMPSAVLNGDNESVVLFSELFVLRL